MGSDENITFKVYLKNEYKTESGVHIQYSISANHETVTTDSEGRVTGIEHGFIARGKDPVGPEMRRFLAAKWLAGARAVYNETDQTLSFRKKEG